MAKAYRIRNASTLFETAETRKIKHLQWVPVPNKHDGKGYKRLMRLPDGPLLYAAWIGIVTVASKCTPRWVLADSDGPLTSEDLSDKTEIPVEVFDAAFKALTSKTIGWLDEIEIKGKTSESPETSGEHPEAPADRPAITARPAIPGEHPETSRTNRIEGKGIEGNRIEVLSLPTFSHNSNSEADSPGSAERESKSKFSAEDRQRYAHAKGMNDGWLFNARDGRYDDLVAAFLASSPEQDVPRETSATTAFDFDGALMSLRFKVDEMKLDADELIEQWPFASAEQKATLRERFFGRPKLAKTSGK